MKPNSHQLPVLFVTDLGPVPAIVEDDYARALERVGSEIERPRSILVMSGHWEADRELRLTSAEWPETIHDFGGFSEEAHQLRYPASGAPALAVRARGLLNAKGLRASLDPTRGFDHGAWTPLTRLFPKADIPIVQFTVPSDREPSQILEVGRALKPLRREGVLIVVSGTLIHNLRRIDFRRQHIEPWAAAFDAWLEPRLESGNVSDLLNYRRLAPQVELAVPTSEHFDPLFFALGAAEGEAFHRHYHGMKYGSVVATIFTLGNRVPVAA